MIHRPGAASSIDIGSPFSGWVWPLTTTPDAAFASGAVGPGVAVDPLTGVLVAPCDGVVSALNASGHAVVVRHAAGPEILAHIGIDTVALSGRGFSPLCAVGTQVRRGQPLIGFDLDAVALAAPSLVSPVILVEAAGFILDLQAQNRRIATGDTLFVLRAATLASGEPGLATADPPVIRRGVVVGLPHGLHARPAAALARLARDRGARGVLSLADGRSANLRSPVALMSLGLAAGQSATLQLSGSEDAATLDALAEFLAGGFAETPETPGIANAPSSLDPVQDAGRLTGLRAAPGQAVGPAVLWAPMLAAPARPAGPPHVEAARLEQALKTLRDDLSAEAAWSRASPTLTAVLEAHVAIVDDDDLRAAALAGIRAGASAEAAWDAAIEGFAVPLERASDPRLAARAADLRDVKTRVAAALAGDSLESDAAPAWGPPDSLPKGAILIARDLPPSVIAKAARAGLAGIALAEGGPTAHAALIAASLGLPMLVRVGPAVLRIPDGSPLRLDADRGYLTLADELPIPVGPSPTAEGTPSRDTAQAITRDGVTVTVLANLGGLDDVGPALAQGAEGCGLLRTEFVFLRSETAPGEAEQRAAYGQVRAALGDRELVIRTLDIGADKSARWLPFPREANPALGLRGVRVSLARPDLLDTQLRAIVGLSTGGPIAIMAPMISTLGELRAVRAALDRACQAMGRTPPRLGVMVETPAAVLIADRLAAEADFLSIGTNDLAQYVLAADRLGGAAAADAMDPAVLRAVSLTIEAAARHRRPVAVCGGLASDPAGVVVLVGLGLRRLSCDPAAIGGVKQRLRTMDTRDCQILARRALAADSAAEVRALLDAAATRDGE